MAGHAMAIEAAFPHEEIIGVEPDGADDFRQSLKTGERVRIEKPVGICDGLLSYDVGQQNWPILRQYVTQAVSLPDLSTQQAMKWLYEKHGLRTEPSGAITTAAVIMGKVDLDGDGDIVIVLSGRNVDETPFRDWIAV